MTRLTRQHLGSLQGSSWQRIKDTSDIEPIGPYRARLLSWFDELVATSSADTILALTHGGPVKTLIPALVQTRGFVFATGVEHSASRVLNCSVTILEVERGVAGGTVRLYADSSYVDQVDTTAAGDADAAEQATAKSSAA